MMGWQIKNQDLKMNGSHPYLWAPSMHYAFLKKRAKNVQLWAIVSSGFSSKNREILHKAVLTPQEYEDYFFWKKNKKKVWKKSKNLLGVFPQVKSGLKKFLSQKEFFLEKN